jgi:hypothetical protein
MTSQANWKAVDQFAGIKKTRSIIWRKRFEILMPMDGKQFLLGVQAFPLLIGQGRGWFDQMELGGFPEFRVVGGDGV